VDRYAVIGNPVEHSRSPFIHARFAKQTGEAVSYGRVLSPLDAFAPTVRTFAAQGGRGCNVTVPFKLEAPALAARLTPRARLAQAANVLRFDADGWVGDNTDGIGLVRDIEQNAGVVLAGRSVLVAGAGGAAAGALGPLIEARPARIVVFNRTTARARSLIERHVGLARENGVDLIAEAPQPADRFDVLINATSASLQGAPSPLPASALGAGVLALDMMYGPAASPFLQWAKAHGASARDGLGMLIEQAAEAFWFWRSVRPQTAPVLAELRAQLDTVPL
jgi:shikimate dehydrogenase